MSAFLYFGRVYKKSAGKLPADLYATYFMRNSDNRPLPR